MQQNVTNVCCLHCAQAKIVILIVTKIWDMVHLAEHSEWFVIWLPERPHEDMLYDHPFAV